MRTRLSVNSPSRKQTATQPSLGSSDLSTTSRSPSSMRSSFIESPLTRTKKVDAALRMSVRFRSIDGSRKSSAGEGKPAETPLAASGTSACVEVSGVMISRRSSSCCMSSSSMALVRMGLRR